MAQPLTYQQLLAEQYEESARDRLVFQTTEREDEDEDDQSQFVPRGSDTRRAQNDLEDQNAYRQFAGNRNLEEDLVKTKDFEDKSKLSVRYNKDVKLNVLNIDSRFRAYIVGGTSSAKPPTSDPTYVSSVLSTFTSSASHFIFRASKQIKNAISIKLSSIEMPNTFWNFLQSRGNTSFLIRVSSYPPNTPTSPAQVAGPWYQVLIPDGYYQTPDIMAAAVQQALQSISALTNSALFACSVQDTFINISNSSDTFYDFDFSTSPFTYVVNPTTSVATLTTSTSALPTTQLYETLGSMLGFDMINVDDPANPYFQLQLQLGLVGPYSLGIDPDHYLYLKINDYSTIIPQSVNDTYYFVFAKIPITVTKGMIIVDSAATNSTTKEYKFLQPTNIQQLDIQLLDMSGTEIVFKRNFSMTLEIEEVVSHALYEKLREL